MRHFALIARVISVARGINLHAHVLESFENPPAHESAVLANASSKYQRVDAP